MNFKFHFKGDRLEFKSLMPDLSNYTTLNEVNIKCGISSRANLNRLLTDSLCFRCGPKSEGKEMVG